MRFENTKGDTPMKNIILIGLPGAGKSTIGVILAKAIRMDFIDTDIVIQELTGEKLQEVIDKKGTDGFLKIEEQAICTLHRNNTVIATGGSVVYSDRAMEHLKSDSIIVYLIISFEEMVRRLRNIKTRGVVLIPGQTLQDLYTQRIPLYEKYADIRIDCSNDSFEKVVTKIMDILQPDAN